MIGQHNLYLDVGCSFIVFNDDPLLPFDPVSGADLMEVKAPKGSVLASLAWSSDCEWYFVVEPIGIYLFNISGNGLFCRKRSADFIRVFLEWPDRFRRRK